jgi:hypothetical protein
MIIIIIMIIIINILLPPPALTHERGPVAEVLGLGGHQVAARLAEVTVQERAQGGGVAARGSGKRVEGLMTKGHSER